MQPRSAYAERRRNLPVMLMPHGDGFAAPLCICRAAPQSSSHRLRFLNGYWVLGGNSRSMAFTNAVHHASSHCGVKASKLLKKRLFCRSPFPERQRHIHEGFVYFLYAYMCCLRFPTQDRGTPEGVLTPNPVSSPALLFEPISLMTLPRILEQTDNNIQFPHLGRGAPDKCLQSAKNQES